MSRSRYSGLLSVLMVTACFSLPVQASAVDDSGVTVHWGYKGNTGPARWGQLDPRFVLCATGKSQSPINLTKKVLFTENTLKIAYQPTPLIIVNNGVTPLEMGEQRILIKDGHSVQLNFTHQAREIITIAGKNYRLIELHFHSPSENAWHNQSFPLEIHFVHQSKDRQVAVLGVFVKGGQQNPTLQKIIDHLPKDKMKAHVINGERIDPTDLSPIQRDHYSFLGSLTTPPCTEGVQWIVMAEPVTASPDQIVKLRKAVGGANARPIQPLNHRSILFTQPAS